MTPCCLHTPDSWSAVDGVSRQENLAVYAVEILMTHSLLIWYAAIDCAQVARDIVIVSLHCTLA